MWLNHFYEHGNYLLTRPNILMPRWNLANQDMFKAIYYRNVHINLELNVHFCIPYGPTMSHGVEKCGYPEQFILNCFQSCRSVCDF